MADGPTLRQGNGALADLPPELLAQIIIHVDSIRSLVNLSQTCRKTHMSLDQDGFRAFVQSRFPYLQAPTTISPFFWKDAAHGMTTLSRNWDRKAFLAWSIHPQAENTQDYRRNRDYFRAGQTMGFVPVIDSYEAWYGGDWSSRKEVVAWGAGSGLVMRIKTMGKESNDIWEASADRDNFNAHRHRLLWAKYHEPGAIEGRDDITSVNLVSHQSQNDLEQVIIGRASGSLARITLSGGLRPVQAGVQVVYETKNRAVRSATSTGSMSLLAACLSDSSLTLYPLETADGEAGPVAEVSVIPAGVSGKTWSSRFLAYDKIAVGYGPSRKPIDIYNISRGELVQSDKRSLALVDPEAESRLDSPGETLSTVTSIYSLAPIVPSSTAGGSHGNMFLSGAYDGLSSRLHDLRTSNSVNLVFRDPVDTYSPIYSLLSIGTERFVAGGGRHSLIKVFDLRMPGENPYHATDAHLWSTKRQRHLQKAVSNESCEAQNRAKFDRRGWNVFVNMRSKRESPVYALSRPSPCSSSLFAGVENHIVQLDMVSIMDRHPDPVFRNRPATQRDRGDVRRQWDPNSDVMPLPMYEHDTGSVNLWKQRSKVEYSEKCVREGWDERWIPGYRDRSGPP